MSSELKILKLFMSDKDIFVSYSDIFKQTPGLDRHIKTILFTIEEYYDKHPIANDMGFPEFETIFNYTQPMNKDKAFVFELVNSALQVSTNPALIKIELEKVTEQHYAGLLAAKITPIIEGSKYGQISQIRDLIDEFEERIGAESLSDDFEPFDMDLADFFAERKADQDVQWPLTRLNESIGGLGRGTSGAVFARPDSGKTSFGVNIACMFAACLKHKNLPGSILYLGNEELIKMTWGRAIASMCNQPYSTLEQSPVQWKNEYLTKGGDRIHIFGAINYMKRVEQLIKHFAPRVTIIDQAPGVSIVGGHAMNDVKRLELTYQTFRNLAQKYDTSMVCMSQADGASANKTWIGLDNMHNSKTDVPGALDWAVGIGAKDEPGQEHVRYINVCKNKLKDGDKPKFPCVFDWKRARYKDK